MKGLVIAFLFCVVLPAILWMVAAGAWKTYYHEDPNHAGSGCFEVAYRAQSQPC